jgi:hypothetical protein
MGFSIGNRLTGFNGLSSGSGFSRGSGLSFPGFEPLVPITDWFLATGVWDPSGVWIDNIPYPDLPFFLAFGVWNDSGFWIDDEVYP